MVSFRPTHYRISLRRSFAGGAYRQEGPTGQRGLLARGAYWPEGPTGLRGGFGPGGLPLGYAPGAHAWVADANRTLGLEKRSASSPCSAGKGCDSVRVVRVQMQNNALLKGASAVR